MASATGWEPSSQDIAPQNHRSAAIWSLLDYASGSIYDHGLWGSGRGPQYARNGDVHLAFQVVGPIAARVAALAGDGAVLVSSTMKDLPAGSGVGFDDRREHELKGVPGTWRLFAATPGQS